MADDLLVKLQLLLENKITKGLSAAKAQLKAGTDDMNKNIDSLKVKWASAWSEMQNQVPVLGRAMAVAANPLTAVVAGAAAAGTGFYKSTQMALEWEKKMAAINVTAQLSQTELTILSDKLLKIGKESATPLKEVPDAFNRIISAGLDTEQSLKVLPLALKAAKAGFVDMEIVAKAGVNVMNSSGEDITKVYDVLFATLNKGAAEMGDIANYLPKVVPAGRQAGLALQETAGAFAYLTAQGQSTEAATTMLQNAFKALQSTDTVANFKKIGVSVYDSNGKIRQLTDIIGDLKGRMDGLTDKQRADLLGSLGLDMRAANAFAVMTQDLEKLKDTINFTTDSQGQLNQAYEDSKTSTDVWREVLNQVQAVMIRIGQVFLPVLKGIGNGLLAVINFVGRWKEVFIAAAAGIGIATIAIKGAVLWAGIMKGATIAWTVAQWALNIAMNANPIGIVIMAISALIGIIMALARRMGGFSNLWNAIKVSFTVGIKQLVENFKYGFSYMWLSVQIFWERIKGWAQWIGQLFKNVGEGIKKALQGDFSGAKEALTRKITTPAGERIKELQAEREALKGAYKDATTKRTLEVVTAWKRKDTQEGEADTTNPDGTPTGTPATPTGTSTGTFNGSGGSVTDSVTGSAKQIRNITVNIGSLNSGGINTTNTSLQNMEPSQIEEWFNGMCQRVLRNLELSY